MDEVRRREQRLAQLCAMLDMRREAYDVALSLGDHRRAEELYDAILSVCKQIDELLDLKGNPENSNENPE